ncbi:Flp pilus assembly protein CpaB [Symbiobacterium terraclitae]|uniref:Flp pilus assembly protein CpaB n=1 Tax=Symbiobacterium terraclitae TaxID=557451 RepID=UPI0035B544FC
MRSRLVRIFASALIAVTATLLLRLSAEPSDTVLQNVVVVTADTDAGAVLDATNLSLIAIPASAVPPNALTEIPAGVLAAQPLWKGQYLFPQMITLNPLFHPRPDDRVMGVPVTLASAGLLRPGDRVDVIHTLSDPRTAETAESRVLLSAVPVVQVLTQQGQPLSATTARNQGTAGTPAVVELLVPLADAPTLAAAITAGPITLARHLPPSAVLPPAPEGVSR